MSSLSILFKSVVLTKLLYAGQVWLADNISLFTNLWSRAMLKISGAEYHPKRVVIEVATGIQPLKMQLESITVKFLIKCLKDPLFKGMLYQIESNRSHPYHHQLIYLLEYFKWKRNSNERRLYLDDINQEEIYYTKELMQKYMHHKWTHHIKDSLQPSEILDNMEEGNLAIQTHTQKLLFPRSSPRSLDTNLMAYLHGSSLQFNKFRHTVTDNSVSPDCSVCPGYVDDPYHRLYECTHYDCSHRCNLPAISTMDRKLVAMNILLRPGAGDLHELRNMVKSILNS